MTGKARSPSVVSRVHRIVSHDERRERRLTMNVIIEILRRQAVQTSVHEHGKLEVDTLPVEVPEHRCNMPAHACVALRAYCFCFAVKSDKTNFIDIHFITRIVKNNV